jgi:hypothetical protein
MTVYFGTVANVFGHIGVEDEPGRDPTGAGTAVEP